MKNQRVSSKFYFEIIEKDLRWGQSSPFSLRQKWIQNPKIERFKKLRIVFLKINKEVSCTNWWKQTKCIAFKRWTVYEEC